MRVHNPRWILLTVSAATIVLAALLLLLARGGSSPAGAAASVEQFAAFDRDPVAADQLPAAALQGLKEKAGSTTGNSRLLVRDSTRGVYLVRETNGYCMVEHEYASEEGAIACNDFPSIAKGYLFVGTTHGTFGVVPDDASSLTVVDRAGRDSPTTSASGGYLSSVSGADFGGVRFARGGSTVSFDLPPIAKGR